LGRRYLYHAYITIIFIILRRAFAAFFPAAGYIDYFASRYFQRARRDDFDNSRAAILLFSFVRAATFDARLRFEMPCCYPVEASPPSTCQH